MGSQKRKMYANKLTKVYIVGEKVVLPTFDS